MAKSLPPVKVPGLRPLGEGWQSPGIRKKPSSCASCLYQKTGAGFCPDQYKTGARLAVILAAPSSDDITEQRPLAGKAGYFIFKNFLEPNGFKMDEIIASHMIRCKPPFDRSKIGPAYPDASIKRRVEGMCRQYDTVHGKDGKLVSGGIATFKPNLFVLTFDPADVHNTSAYYRQIFEDVRKAAHFVGLGYRVCVLFGKEACEAHAPFIKDNGGLKAWRGHWLEKELEEIKVEGGELRSFK